ncbi:DNA mismatch repair protein MutS [uncultured Duncaniella sp.]|jgi:hypothetical protein|uniref:DNA mismatch repair protein MutS n=2 Tax=Bacteroidales TaxID=171549 RepID=UPI00272B5F86|nr:DNA mismatch repair protein MutS [uncultured Duncaniella sp.]
MKSAIPKMDKELSGILRQHDEMKRKHPDAILLFRVKNTYMTFKDDAVKSAEILGIAASDRQFEKGQIAKTASFPHEALDTFLPKLVRAGMRVAICEQLDNSRQKKVENNIPPNNNDMPRKKKEESPKEEQPKVQAKEPKAEAKTEAKAEKSEQQERKPREPQMVTVNGEKVTHGHAYQSKTNPEDWFFTAKIDGQQLKPQKMDPADLAAYQSKEMTVPQLMEKYYPTKLMQRVPEVAYQVPNVLSGPGGNMTIDKFNVYKETDETRADYGKYKFYAQVGDKKMSTTASREDLNAYFDRVATPAQLVERNFGARLHLPSHYEQFRLPEGVDPKGIRVGKDKEGKWGVSVDLGEGRGRTSRQEISFDDGYSLFKTKSASREQIAAKYLGQEISAKLAQPLGMEKSASMKM